MHSTIVGMNMNKYYYHFILNMVVVVMVKAARSYQSCLATAQGLWSFGLWEAALIYLRTLPYSNLLAL